jgi:hypothetical protein
MKASLRLKKLWLEIEGGTQKELFENLASATEVFGEETCGLCQSEQINFAIRVVTVGKKVYTYHEYHCKKCFARLSLGQNQEGGTLFPIRQLLPTGKPDRAEGKFGKHNGWTQFKGDPKDEEGEEGKGGTKTTNKK